MSEPKYKIVFNGQLAEGFAVGTVKANFSKLFKIDEQRAEALFSGNIVILKRDLDGPTAKKYRAVLHKAGAITAIRAMQTEQAAANPASTPASEPAAATPKPSTQMTEDDWSLAPSGEMLLRKEERKEFTPRELDLGHISLKSSFGPIEDEADAEPEPPAPDTSHMSIAETGATIGDDSFVTPPVAVAELKASLAPAGADLVDPQPEAELPDIDVSHIDLAD